MRRITVTGLLTTLLPAALLAAPAAATQGIDVVADGIVGIAVEPVGTTLVPGVGANRTIRLVVTMPETWRLDAVAGNSEVPFLLQVDNGTLFQHAFGGDTSSSVNPAVFDFFPSLQWDSFVTIGSLDSTGAPYLSNNMSEIGVNWDEFNTSSSINMSNGGWWVIPTEQQGEQAAFADTCGRTRQGVCIAQLTLLGDNATVSFKALLQGKDEYGVAWQAHISISQTTMDDRSTADVLQGCVCDLNTDDRVDVSDLLDMLSNWSDVPCMDFNVDSAVNAFDLTELLGAWGPCSTD
jgi:hypothetical protein